MDRWPSGITGILKATTFFFTFGYRFLLFILFFFVGIIILIRFRERLPIAKLTIESFGTFSQSVQSLLSGWSHIHEISLSFSFSLSLSLSLFLSLSVCLFVHLSIYPSFFSSFLSIYFFVEERPSGDSNYQGTAQLIYHRFIESLLENNSRLNVVPI